MIIPINVIVYSFDTQIVALDFFHLASLLSTFYIQQNNIFVVFIGNEYSKEKNAFKQNVIQKIEHKFHGNIHQSIKSIFSADSLLCRLTFSSSQTRANLLLLYFLLLALLYSTVLHNSTYHPHVAYRPLHLTYNKF